MKSSKTVLFKKKLMKGMKKIYKKNDLKKITKKK